MNKNWKLFTNKRELILVVGVFIGGIVGLHFLLRWLKSFVVFDMDNYWPISIMLPKYPQWQDIPILVSIFLLWWGVYRYEWRRIRLPALLVVVFFLTISTNSLHGISAGYVEPIVGRIQDDASSYYPDARSVQDLGNFLKHYTDIQPYLNAHSRVHPPGPVLFFYSVIRLGIPPWLTAIILSILGVMGFALFYKLLEVYKYPAKLRVLVVAILGLIPATQIYFLAGIDSLIFTLFLLVWYLFIKSSAWQNAMYAGLALCLAAWFSYAVVWLVGAMVISDFWEHRNLKRVGKIILVTIGCYVGLYLLTGFDYWKSFMIAMSFEGTEGFYALVDFKSYLATRFEDLIEILVFAGPLVSWWFIKGLLLKRFDSALWRDGVSGCLMFLVFIGLGAYYTGETARAAAYMYIPLMLIMGEWVQLRKPKEAEQFLWLSFILVQTVLMQMFGWYGW